MYCNFFLIDQKVVLFSDFFVIWSVLVHNAQESGQVSNRFKKKRFG